MNHLTLDAICVPSDDVVSREIEGELILVPIASGIGDLEDELYTLNETGRAIWQHLDGKRTLAEVAYDIVKSSTPPLRRSPVMCSGLPGNSYSGRFWSAGANRVAGGPEKRGRRWPPLRAVPGHFPCGRKEDIWRNQHHHGILFQP